MALLVQQCIASGLTAYEFGRRAGLTKDQSARLNREIRVSTAGTSRQTPSGSIIPQNAAHSLSILSNRIVNAMLGTGQRAVEVLERMNARYEPRHVVGDDGEKKLEHPEPSKEDLMQWKWAYGVCANMITLARKDARDPGPGTQEPAKLEPIQRVMDGAPPGMLTVIPSAGAVEQNAA